MDPKRLRKILQANAKKARAVLAANKAAKKAANVAGPLTLKQSQFVEAYLTDGNSSSAARAAKYAIPGTAGCKLLKYPPIKAELARRRSELMKSTVVTPERIIAEHAAVGFSDFVAYLPVLATAQNQREALEGLPPEVRHAIKKADFDAKTGRIVRLELHAKDPSLKSLQSIFGMDRQRLEVPSPNGEAIPISVAREIIEAAYRVTA
jgi:Terminase small subunit